MKQQIFTATPKYENKIKFYEIALPIHCVIIDCWVESPGSDGEPILNILVYVRSKTGVLKKRKFYTISINDTELPDNLTYIMPVRSSLTHLWQNSQITPLLGSEPSDK